MRRCLKIWVEVEAVPQQGVGLDAERAQFYAPKLLEATIVATDNSRSVGSLVLAADVAYIEE